MNHEEREKDRYKEIELKYKRFEVVTRLIAAFAAIASAIAAFLAIRDYTRTSMPQPLTAPPVAPSAPISPSAPVPPAGTSVDSPARSEPSIRSPQSAPNRINQAAPSTSQGASSQDDDDTEAEDE